MVIHIASGVVNEIPFYFCIHIQWNAIKKSIVVHCKIIIDLLPEKCEPKREKETIEINRKTNHKLQAVFVIMTNVNWSTNNQCPLYSHKHKLTPNQPLIYITN